MPPTYRQTQGNNYSGIFEIASIGFASVNALAAAQFDSVVITNGIPANVEIIGMYTKTVIPFVSVTRPIQNIALGLDGARPQVYPISNWQVSSVETTTLDSQRFFPPDGYSQFNKPAQDIYVEFDWIADNNPQDYSAGEIKVYLEYRSFPTL